MEWNVGFLLIANYKTDTISTHNQPEVMVFLFCFTDLKKKITSDSLSTVNIYKNIDAHMISNNQVKHFLFLCVIWQTRGKKKIFWGGGFLPVVTLSFSVFMFCLSALAHRHLSSLSSFPFLLSCFCSRSASLPWGPPLPFSLPPFILHPTPAVSHPGLR